MVLGSCARKPGKSLTSAYQGLGLNPINPKDKESVPSDKLDDSD